MLGSHKQTFTKTKFVASDCWLSRTFQRILLICEMARRSVIFIDALFAVANMLISQRGATSSEGRAGATFLREISEEKYIQLGMLADASDEASKTCHELDTDGFDESTLFAVLEEHQERLYTLFVKGLCLVTPGYTMFALEALKEVRVSTIGQEIIQNTPNKSELEFCIIFASPKTGMHKHNRVLPCPIAMRIPPAGGREGMGGVAGAMLLREV